MTTSPGPRRFGITLRPEYYAGLAEDESLWPDCVELNTDEFLGVHGGKRIRRLERVCRTRPVSLHGTSLSIGSVDPLDARYLQELKALIQRTEPVSISDHLAWSSFGGRTFDLLPLPYTEESLAHVVRRVEQVQEALGRQILLENPSTYLAFADSTLAEWDFLSALSEAADCGILLDVNNVCVSGYNNGFDPFEYIRALPAGRVREIHLSGYRQLDGLRLDTHETPIPDDVWAVYVEASRRFGEILTIVEWGAEGPPLAGAVAECRSAASRAEAAL